MTDYNGKLYRSGYTGLVHGDIAKFLHKTLTTDEQTVVTGLIASIEKHIARQCERNLAPAGSSNAYYETFDAGYNQYDLYNLPVKEVTKITLDGNSVYVKGGGSNTLDLNTDFFVYPGYIEFDTAPESATDNRQALKIYYEIETIADEDLVLAVKQWVSDIFLSSEYAGKSMTSVGVQGANMSFSPDSIPSYIKLVIENYRVPRL